MISEKTYSYYAEKRDGIDVIRIENTDHLDVSSIFECGQAFRFDPVAGSAHAAEYSGVAYGRFISVAQDGDTVYIYNSTEEDFLNIWSRYFGLELDYGGIARDILSRSDKPVLASAVEIGRVIRILRQEPWEAVCSFIISQNNNIPRIKKLVASLSETLGEEIDTRHMLAHGGRGRDHAFPTPESVNAAGIDLIFSLKTGFRAKYIADAAARICDGRLSLDEVAKAETTEEAKRMLMEVNGIGPKVALCSLLFGFARYDAFPIDVWIRRVTEKYFPEDFTPDSLGPYAGIAQQYLFFYERGV